MHHLQLLQLHHRMEPSTNAAPRADHGASKRTLQRPCALLYDTALQA